MAHGIELRNGCPGTEIWCGYLDGTIQSEEKAQLAAHLEGVEKRWTSLEREDADLKRSEIGREALDVLEEVWGERGVRGLE